MASSPTLHWTLPAPCNSSVLRTAFLTLLLLSPVSGLKAECECLWEGSFVEVHPVTDRVISGTVISAKGNSIDVGVERDLRGGDAFDIVRIWLGTEDYPCRPDPKEFPPESTWIMALDRINEVPEGGFNIDTPNISYGRVGDYMLSSCGGYWLKRTGPVVTGNLVNAPRWDHEPQMTPVLVEVVANHVMGRIGSDAVLEASREDPALLRLKLDTKAFVRGDMEFLDDEDNDD